MLSNSVVVSAEIEKHNKDNDCWIVINGKVYDATSVLDWHPGGKAKLVNISTNWSIVR
jgi:cytochrome b involved in lipid metabolism